MVCVLQDINSGTIRINADMSGYDHNQSQVQHGQLQQQQHFQTAHIQTHPQIPYQQHAIQQQQRLQHQVNIRTINGNHFNVSTLAYATHTHQPLLPQQQQQQQQQMTAIVVVSAPANITESTTAVIPPPPTSRILTTAAATISPITKCEQGLQKQQGQSKYLDNNQISGCSLPLKSQQLKQQHASLVKLLESAPITAKTNNNNFNNISEKILHIDTQAAPTVQATTATTKPSPQVIILPQQQRQQQIQLRQQQQFVYLRKQQRRTLPIITQLQSQQQRTAQVKKLKNSYTNSLAKQQQQLSQTELQDTLCIGNMTIINSSNSGNCDDKINHINTSNFIPITTATTTTSTTNNLNQINYNNNNKIINRKNCNVHDNNSICHNVHKLTKQKPKHQESLVVVVMNDSATSSNSATLFSSASATSSSSSSAVSASLMPHNMCSTKTSMANHNNNNSLSYSQDQEKQLSRLPSSETTTILNETPRIRLKKGKINHNMKQKMVKQETKINEDRRHFYGKKCCTHSHNQKKQDDHCLLQKFEEKLLHENDMAMDSQKNTTNLRKINEQQQTKIVVDTVESQQDHQQQQQQQQYPWKKLRHYREQLEKEQLLQQQKLYHRESEHFEERQYKDIGEDVAEETFLKHYGAKELTAIANHSKSSPCSSASSDTKRLTTVIKTEINLTEQTHKEIAILLQQQHEDYQQQQQQRDSSDCNSSLMSSLNIQNGCEQEQHRIQQRQQALSPLFINEHIEDEEILTMVKKTANNEKNADETMENMVLKQTATIQPKQPQKMKQIRHSQSCHVVISSVCDYHNEHLICDCHCHNCNDQHSSQISSSTVSLSPSSTPSLLSSMTTKTSVMTDMNNEVKTTEHNTMNYLCQKFVEHLETSHCNQIVIPLKNHAIKYAGCIKLKKGQEEQQQHQQQQESQLQQPNNVNNILDENNTAINKKRVNHKGEGFFRRSIQQKIQYRPCTKNQQCSILRINRNRCQYCRLKKCIAVGMSRDAVRFGRVPKREKARIMAAMQQSTQNRGQQNALVTELDDQPRLMTTVLRAHLDTCAFTREKVAALRQQACECPTYSMPTLLACPLNPAPEFSSEMEFSQRFAYVIRGIIDFASKIPGFQFLNQDDKFTLLKAGLFDALFVRLFYMFDSSINSIICLNGEVIRRDDIQNGTNARFLVDSTFKFAERMNSMNLSDAEIGLFCAIVLFTPDRPGLRNVELIEKMYTSLKGCLQTIINQNRPEQPDFINTLLDTIPDLRTLSTLHTEKLVVFRTEHKDLLRQQICPDESRSSPPKSPQAWEDNRIDVEAKSPLGSVSSTESGDIDYQTASSTVPVIGSSSPSDTHNHDAHYQQASSLASTAPLLAATLSSSNILRNRANSGSSGDSNGDLDLIGSHAHLTQNGLTITPIIRAHPRQQLHQQQHHLNPSPGVVQRRYRKLDSPTDSGIESGNEKNESKAVSSGGSSSCSSPRSSVDDILDCPDGTTGTSVTAIATTIPVNVSVSPIRSPQPTTVAASSTSGPVIDNSGINPSTSTLKRQIAEDMPVLKRVLQAPPLYDTNSLMDEAYKPHKKFRALRHREYETIETDASSSTNINNTISTNRIPVSSPVHQIVSVPLEASAENTPLSAPPNITGQVLSVSAQAIVSLTTPSSPPSTTHHQNQSYVHLTRPSSSNANSNLMHEQQLSPIHPPQTQQPQLSSLSSTHSVLAKSLMAEPRMTPEQIKRSDIIQNYIMRDTNSNSLRICSPHGNGSRSPATQNLSINNNYAPSGCVGNASPSSSSSSNSNCTSPSRNQVSSMASPPPMENVAGTETGQISNLQRWQEHSVITTISINQRQSSVSPNSNGSLSSASSVHSTASSTNNSGCPYFQSPHSTSTSISPTHTTPPSSNHTHQHRHHATTPRLLELEVTIADSQQPLNLSKKSPNPPPNKLHALMAAATVAQRYPQVISDVAVTATTNSMLNNNSSSHNTNNNNNNNTNSSNSNNNSQVQVHKVMLEA